MKSRKIIVIILGFTFVVGLFLLQIFYGNCKEISDLKAKQFNGVVVKKYFSRVPNIDIQVDNGKSMETIPMFCSELNDKIKLGDSVCKFGGENKCVIFRKDSVFSIKYYYEDSCKCN